MRLDSKYYSFCKEVGFMKENFSKQGALDAIKKAIREAKAADPKFVQEVEKLTLTSREVSMRVCALYSYDINVEYVVGGNIKDAHIQDFGYSGTPDSLYITKYHGQGDYTVITDVSKIPYEIFNDRNLFTYDGMKGALTKAIESHLPSSTTSFRSKDWSVSAYFVPVLTIVVKYGGKDYAMNYNLHNGHYHWDYPDNPALIKKGKAARGLTALIKLAGVFFGFLGLFTALSGFNVPALMSTALPLLVMFFINKKTKKDKNYWRNVFLKNPEKSMVKVLMPAIIIGVLGVVAMIMGMSLAG